MTTVWSFKTRNFTVSCRFEDEDLPPEDCFYFQEDIDAIHRGGFMWFCAVVEVETNGRVIGGDSLGGCAYRTAEDFIASHRGPDPMDRNCTALRAKHGPNSFVCHYFPDMVRSAIADARLTLSRRGR